MDAGPAGRCRRAVPAPPGLRLSDAAGGRRLAVAGGRDPAAALGRTTLTIPAFDAAQVDHGRGGQRLATLGPRRLRGQTRADSARSPVVVFTEECYGVMAVEGLRAAVGFHAKRGLLPKLSGPGRPPGPT